MISNAVDFIFAEDRAAYAAKVYDPLDLFRRNGFAAGELDLRNHFGSP